MHTLVEIKGIGPRSKERLTKLGICSVFDLLFHLPRAYQDRTRLMPINALREGVSVAVEGVIEKTEIVYRGRRQLLCYLREGVGVLLLRFFHFNQAQYQSLLPGSRLRCFGEVRRGYRFYEMTHPEYRRILGEIPAPMEENLTPIYPMTEGLAQTLFRRWILQALSFAQKAQSLQELLPESILNEHAFPTLIDALSYIHQPPPDASLSLLSENQHPTQVRLIFEELLAHHLSLCCLREKTRQENAPVLTFKESDISTFTAKLPFQLTGAQKRVFQEIVQDVSGSSPMMRLIQGDVGSGKTVVAAMAMLLAISSGYQAALMAPTEILAEQHVKNLSEWFKPFSISVVWLTGSLTGKKRKEALQKIASGEAKIIIGTHALFQEDVLFKNLAFVVVDEQHRFGVAQRLSLRDKGIGHPHQLIMTATPIPRTLTMAAYADLDHSILDEMPPGRTPITTLLLSNTRRQEIIDRIHNICKAGRQVYWVCTLIEESEILECEAAEATYETLKKQLPDLSIALIHGRLKPKEKEKIMLDFKAGRYALLVATTVVEVGVDVPNATLMVIENAERLGLSQLHQLRGRVGRGEAESHCVLLYQTPLSMHAEARLKVMRETTNGFIIAEKDLALRGPGEMLGTAQSGFVDMRIAHIVRDQAWFPFVQKAAKEILQKDPQKVDLIIKRWLGRKTQYGHVG